MTPPEDKDHKALENLEGALVEDILSTSDEDILAEAREEGIDPEALAANMRASFEKTIAANRKARLTAARAAVAADRAHRATDLPRDPACLHATAI
jgi:hypothetical protein